MPEQEKPPKLGEWFREQVYRRFGIPGLVGLTILFAAIYVYTNWTKVKTWPGVTVVVTYLTRDVVPKADPQRYSILVAHLENDVKEEHERLIIANLKGFKGVQTLRLDRTISLEGQPEEMEKRGREAAQRYLEQSGASVLIWGAVIKLDDKTGYDLYWTPSNAEARKSGLLDAQLRLPEVFWGELADILGLQVSSKAAEFAAQEERYVADQLPPFIARVQKLVQNSGGRPGWDGKARGAMLVILGDSLYTLGHQSGQNKHLEDAVKAYREALNDYTQDRTPQDWARTQNNLGIASQCLGEREEGTEKLKEAVAAYGEALKVYTQEGAPQDWAMVQTNLGNALQDLGKREESKERYQKAEEAYLGALNVRTRDRMLLEWATTQNELGLLLTNLGDWLNSIWRLKKAVEIHREVLKELNREREPLDWANTQDNLGLALVFLGQRLAHSKGRFEKAVEAHKEALKVYTRERAPLRWAMIQNNLGLALENLGENIFFTSWEKEKGIERLKEAVVAYKAALEFLEQAQVLHYAKIAKVNLQRAEALVRDRQQ